MDENEEDFPDIESKEVRHYYRQCQKCWKRRGPNVKLFVCSSCKITSYCSTECQKADWKFHKKTCRANEDYRTQMAAHDAVTVAKSLASGQDLDRPLASEVGVEVGEFLKRFRPMICQAGYRCLGIKRGDPDAWKHNVFQMRVERIPNPPPHSRPWARYKITDAKATSFSEMLAVHGDMLQDTFKQGDVYHAENERVGCIGTITTVIECSSAGPHMRFVSWGGYGPDAWDDVQPGEDWCATLVDSVERISGRMP